MRTQITELKRLALVAMLTALLGVTTMAAHNVQTASADSEPGRLPPAHWWGPPLLPDLQVTEVVENYSQTRGRYLEVTVQNAGAVAVNGAYVGGWWNGRLFPPAPPIPHLASGEFTTVPLYLVDGYNPTCEFRAVVMVDPANHIAESNETNNTLSVTTIC